MKSSTGNIAVIGKLVVTGALLFSLLPAASYAESMSDRKADSVPIEQWSWQPTVNMQEIEQLEPTAAGAAVGTTAEQQESMMAEHSEGGAKNADSRKEYNNIYAREGRSNN